MNNQYINIKQANNTITIKISTHAIERITERKIKLDVIKSSILSLCNHFDTLLNSETMIINELSQVSVLIGVAANTKTQGYYITVITVLDNDNIFIKNNTTVARLHE